MKGRNEQGTQSEHQEAKQSHVEEKPNMVARLLLHGFHVATNKLRQQWSHPGDKLTRHTKRKTGWYKNECLCIYLCLCVCVSATRTHTHTHTHTHTCKPAQHTHKKARSGWGLLSLWNEAIKACTELTLELIRRIVVLGLLHSQNSDVEVGQSLLDTLYKSGIIAFHHHTHLTRLCINHAVRQRAKHTPQQRPEQIWECNNND